MNSSGPNNDISLISLSSNMGITYSYRVRDKSEL